jgi:hypothetical protein
MIENGVIVTLSPLVSYDIPVFDDVSVFEAKKRVGFFKPHDIGLVLDQNKNWLKLLTSANACGWVHIGPFNKID